MRLQSAIFFLPDALPQVGADSASAEKVLSILKMEGVWMYAVTALPRSRAEQALRTVRLDSCFRGILTEGESGCAVCSREMLEKAMRRLHSQKTDTVVFAGTEDTVRAAKNAGFRTVAVGGGVGENEWQEMCAIADEALTDYADWLNLT